MPPPTNNAAAAAHRLDMVIKAGARASEASLNVIGMLITNEVKVSITRLYPPASEPDTPPHLRTGGLRQSYRYAVTPKRGRRVANVAVYSDATTVQPVPPHKRVIYASFLEFGTSNMAARPHLRPAVEKIRPLIPGTIRSAWAQGVRRANGGGRRV